jgi:hypothetical protein
MTFDCFLDGFEDGWLGLHKELSFVIYIKVKRRMGGENENEKDFDVRVVCSIEFGCPIRECLWHINWSLVDEEHESVFL